MPTPVRRLFDYRVPSSYASFAFQPGQRLLAPFGSRRLVGILVATTDHSDWPVEQLKTIIKPLDNEPVLAPLLFKLGQWASHYYQHPLGEVFSHMLPVLVRQGHELLDLQPQRWQLTPKGQAIKLEQLARAPKQQQLLELLQTHPAGLTKEQLTAAAIGRPQLKRFMDQQWLVRVIQPNKVAEFTLSSSPLTLNSQQQQAVAAINGAHGQFQPFLLDGITGSGKTEVYLQVIAQVLAQGQQALVLVPEIGLTPQTLQRFRQRFGDKVALLHSKLTDRERLTAWQQANSAKIGVIIGTRSAVFVPLANPGIIILDEEHDISFKQQDGFRYSARDLAIVRAKLSQIPVILGSATPSFESLNNVQQGRYRLLTLTSRAGQASAPEFVPIDLRSQVVEQGFSTAVLTAIKDHLVRGEQVLVFINRRGYAPLIICHDCGWTAECSLCNRPYTWHREKQRLRCHHCGAEAAVPVHCAACGNTALQATGLGTERIAQTLKQLFTDFPVLRIDRDSTQRKTALATMLDQIATGKPCILVGTQMLAKGHHLPKVTLVVVLDADNGLYSSDFRAPERLAQLLTQVAGRAGRSEHPGKVLIQTHQPDHELLNCLLTQGYRRFAQRALTERQQAELPPFSYLALVRAEARDEQEPMAFLQQALGQIPTLEGVQVLGPMPSPMAKKAGRYRAYLVLQAVQPGRLQRLLSPLLIHLENTKQGRRVRWSVDVDPMDIV
jgi:primosomal protein N' (replication factor Y)